MSNINTESIQNIEQTMRTLKLGGLVKEWRNVVYRNNEQYLRDLFDIEIREREANRVSRMIKLAGFRVIKTMDSFAWKPDVQLPTTITCEEIETASFVKEKENLILMGTVGTGKTHLATAIAVSMCEQGRQVRFYTAAGLANILMEKNRKGQLSSFIDTLQKVELLVLDEVGFVTLHKEASELLYQVISDCYERRSLIITSNLEFAQWNSVFGGEGMIAKKMTAAMIERLIHHSHIVVFGGLSYRLEESMQRQRRGGKA